jgi:succinate-semialdehyde dehydrogenase/glutarate-semialdehyde dehydrogenase
MDTPNPATRSARNILAATQGLYIGGVWRPPMGGETIAVLNPSTERVLAQVPDATLEDAAAAVEAAVKAAPEWAASPPRKLSEILRRCFELMTERSEDLAELISLENGKAIRHARGEVAYAAEFFRWNAEDFATAPSGTNRIILDYQPMSICVLHDSGTGGQRGL